MAQQSKKLVEERGILSLPDPLRGLLLPSETVNTVCTLYVCNDISLEEKFLKRRVNSYQRVQIRLVLSNLKEMHYKFKESSRFQNLKFAELRPIHFVWYTLKYICPIHQMSR